MTNLTRDLRSLHLPTEFQSEGEPKRPNDRPVSYRRQHALTVYDRLNDADGHPDRPTYIREARRTKGRPHAAKAQAKVKNDGYAVPARDWDSFRFNHLRGQCDWLLKEVAAGGKPKIMAKLEAELDRILSDLIATGKGHVNVQRYAAILFNRRQFVRDGIERNRTKVDPTARARTAAKAHAALAESADRGW